MGLVVTLTIALLMYHTGWLLTVDLMLRGGNLLGFVVPTALLHSMHASAPMQAGAVTDVMDAWPIFPVVRASRDQQAVEIT